MTGRCSLIQICNLDKDKIYYSKSMHQPTEKTVTKQGHNKGRVPGVPRIPHPPTFQSFHFFDKGGIKKLHVSRKYICNREHITKLNYNTINLHLYLQKLDRCLILQLAIEEIFLPAYDIHMHSERCNITNLSRW